VAPTATEADYLAKVTLLRGAAAGLESLQREPNAEGLVVRSDGALMQSDGLAAYL
jgi:thiamine biosynthesis lipoprotein ApbE